MASLHLRGCADHEPVASFQVFSGNLIFLSAEQSQAEQMRTFLSVGVSVHSRVFLLFMHFFMGLLTFILPDTCICFNLL